MNFGQVLFERGKLLPKTQQLLSNNLISVLKDSLLPGSEFWDASKTLKALMEKGYFEDSEREKDGQENGGKEGLSCWPDELKEMLSDGKNI